MAKKLLLAVLLALGGVALAIVLGLAYLGFIPGLSSLFGSDQPRDLGVTYTPEDLARVLERTGVSTETRQGDVSVAETIQFSGSQEMTDAFTSAELSAMVNNLDWEYRLFSDVQVLVGEDGTTQMSGILNVDHFDGYAERFGVPPQYVAEAKNYLNWVQVNPPFYLEGKATVENGQVSFDVTTAEVGRIPLPADVIATADGPAESLAEAVMMQVPGLEVRSLSFDKGEMSFDGAWPEETIMYK